MLHIWFHICPWFCFGQERVCTGLQHTDWEVIGGPRIAACALETLRIFQLALILKIHAGIFKEW